jgi:hypothetical protein
LIPDAISFAQQARVNGSYGAEDDIVVESTGSLLEQNFVCGYTGQEMAKPMVTPCGHVASHQGFESYFGASAGDKVCFHEGCSARFFKVDLVEDYRTSALMLHQKTLRVHKQAAADVEEDIEQDSGDGAVAAVSPVGASPQIKKEPRRRA